MPNGSEDTAPKTSAPKKETPLYPIAQHALSWRCWQKIPNNAHKPLKPHDISCGKRWSVNANFCGRLHTSNVGSENYSVTSDKNIALTPCPLPSPRLIPSTTQPSKKPTANKPLHAPSQTTRPRPAPRPAQSIRPTDAPRRGEPSTSCGSACFPPLEPLPFCSGCLALPPPNNPKASTQKKRVRVIFKRNCCG